MRDSHTDHKKAPRNKIEECVGTLFNHKKIEGNKKEYEDDHKCIMDPINRTTKSSFLIPKMLK